MPRFPASSQRAAKMLRALAHPARLGILRALATAGACRCGDIVSAMPLAQSTVSEHLRILRDAGLIRSRSEGAACCYSIEPKALAIVLGDLQSLVAEVARPKGSAYARHDA